MLRFEEPYIYATMHDCKNNLSKLLRILQDTENNYRGVIVQKRGQRVGMLVPMNLEGQSGAEQGISSGLGPVELMGDL